MKFQQIRGSGIFVPTVSLQKGDSRVVIVGLSHIGSPRYYSRLQKLLAHKERAGWKVLYERLIDDSDMRHHDPELEELGKRWLSLNIKFWRMFCDAYGLAYQMDHIKIQPAWTDIDETTEERNAILPKSKERLLEQCQFVQENIEKHLEHFPRMIEAFFDIDTLHVRMKKIDERHKGSLIESRDAHAVKKIVSHALVFNCITIWGCAHVPGIVAGLAEKGFKVVSIKWSQMMSVSLPAEK